MGNPYAAAHAYITRTFPADVEAEIDARFGTVTRNRKDASLLASELIKDAAGCTHLFVTATDQITGELIEALSGRLEAIATLSVGYNHIDLEAAQAHGIAVFNTPDVLSEACAEVAMMLLLNAARRAHEGNLLVRSGLWRGWAPTQLIGIGLVGKRLGILGMGRIGQQFAQRARGFGLEIHYHNRKRLPLEKENGAIFHETADSLLAASHFFSINAPATSELAGFLDRRRIAMLPAGAVVINISRGDIVDDDALIAALESGHLFAAGLDVFRNEPALDPRYKVMENVFLTPHIGSATKEVRNAMGSMLLDGIDGHFRGVSAANRLV